MLVVHIIMQPENGYINIITDALTTDKERYNYITNSLCLQYGLILIKFC